MPHGESTYFLLSPKTETTRPVGCLARRRSAIAAAALWQQNPGEARWPPGRWDAVLVSSTFVDSWGVVLH